MAEKEKYEGNKRLLTVTRTDYTVKIIRAYRRKVNTKNKTENGTKKMFIEFSDFQDV